MSSDNKYGEGVQSKQNHAADWKTYLLLNADAYAPARFVDVQTALQTLLAITPDVYVSPPKTSQEVKPLLHVPKDLPTTLALTGKARSGKDVLADFVTENYKGVHRFAFSDPIKAEVNEYLSHYPYTVNGQTQVHFIGEHNKSLPHYRHALQAWGMARRDEEEEYWGHALKAKVAELKSRGSKLILITGARVLSDLKIITDIDGSVIRVVRPLNDYIAEHEVESGLDHLSDSYFYATVYNMVEGNLDAFHDNINAVLHNKPQPHPFVEQTSI